ncbi:MAG: DUF1722 domain-containing protein [Gammaproteobacteria bacterium]|nr:DUF1722 domain-containing protein [Gammaproteobacteria bacterium]MCW8909621.1 DUF1722 domain-containing protein [Gammaproteobacteria bacterium]MCW9005846.1 DUF1722 domain-containing protein [Gammaproteobacteria bacterium]MCW9056862.1 DUF1722 domain-containing protein [Gammaproteobacteria bacterium]
MRIWDINPGYLNRQSLLGEHRELHGIVSIIRNNKKGYSKHPETLRWIGYGWALKQRHKLLVAEMSLRGYVDRSPVLLRSNPEVWPAHYIDSPENQINILRNKYKMLEDGRIPLPKNAQQLWAQHKYSVMARDISAYKDIGKWVTSKSGSKELGNTALEVTKLLRTPPEPRLIENTLLHMWGYVSKYTSISGKELNSLSMKALLNKVQQLSLANNVSYLIESTSLSELDAWTI